MENGWKRVGLETASYSRRKWVVFLDLNLPQDPHSIPPSLLVDDDTAHIINYGGNHIKNLRLSVEGSLKKLRTSYIDILYVHWWDWATSVKEVMDSLHNLVVAGKVLYLGVSDTPAWVISKANQYANDHGKTPFAIYQGHWNVLDRTFEREFIPMARSEGVYTQFLSLLVASSDVHFQQGWRSHLLACLVLRGCGQTR